MHIVFGLDLADYINWIELQPSEKVRQKLKNHSRLPSTFKSQCIVITWMVKTKANTIDAKAISE
jgi:hypothetical protein